MKNYKQILLVSFFIGIAIDYFGLILLNVNVRFYDVIREVWGFTVILPLAYGLFVFLVNQIKLKSSSILIISSAIYSLLIMVLIFSIRYSNELGIAIWWLYWGGFLPALLIGSVLGYLITPEPPAESRC